MTRTIPVVRDRVAPLVGAAGALLVLVLAACGGAASGPPAATPEQHVDLRLGMYANLTHAPALVGVSKGFFAQALGSSVTLKTSIFNAGPDAVTALISNSIDATYVGPNPAINAFVQSHGEAVRIVSGATTGGAALVVKPSINSAADLKGKTLATPQLGNTQDVALRYWLSQHGLKTTPEGGGDVSIHPQDNSQTVLTFRAGQIDGAWVPEPYATQLVVQGGGKILVDERSLWPNGKFPTTLLAVRTDFLKQHPTVVRHLLDGQVAATDFLNSQAAAAQQAVNDAIAAITGKRLQDQIIGEAWTRLTFTEDPAASSFQTAARHAQSLGLLQSVNLKGIFNLTLVNQALEAVRQPAVAGL